MLKRLLNPDSAVGAFVWYTLAACVMTWPVVRHLTTGVPEDLGDPLLNVWLLGWDASHILRFLRGDLAAFSGFWTGNIFYPSPLTAAYSEHLMGEAVQILPVYAATGNLILCYNLLLLSTFILSALGAFLLVRELTSNGPACAARSGGIAATARPRHSSAWTEPSDGGRAGFLAGLLYGFALCRAQHLGHLQVLSSQWMPFVLFGFRRYFVTGRRRALVGAALALVVQNLSCNYYLMFFAPFVAAYVLYEMASRRLLRDARTWGAVLLTAAVVAVVTVPFLLPYAWARQQHLFTARGPAEVRAFSADVLSYLTACPSLHVWGGWLRAFPKEAGWMFPGAVTLALGVTGGVLAVRARRRAGSDRSAAGRGSIALFYLLAAVAALWLSFGLRVEVMGHPVAPGLFAVLYAYVPGYDGLRAVELHAMLVVLFLAVLAGFAADALARRRRAGRGLVLALGVAFLVEAASMPVRVQAPWAGFDAGLEAGLGPGALQLYRHVGSLPADAILIEFPFGTPPPLDADTRYMYSSTFHWRRLVNGASGWSPPDYASRIERLAHAGDRPQQAWETLAASGATHAIVHEDLYPGGEGNGVSDWLRAYGARELLLAGSHRLFELPRPGR